MRSEGMAYRPDIDGLRAIAVLAVVFYHAGWAAFAGGFTGVDIFFAISGYLITRIIADGIASGTFRFQDFYDRRIRRIFPAIFFMLPIVLGAGYLFLAPADYQTLARSAVWTVAFVSNVFFMNNTGYFDASSDTMALLHTWSLAVEEQFYVVWPLVLILLAKFMRPTSRPFLLAIAVLAMLSFVWSAYTTHDEAHAAFYLAWSRAWELLAGGCLALLVLPAWPKWLVEIAALAGLVLIGWGIFALTDAMPYPGVNALYPVAGASLLLFSGPATLVARILSIAPLRAVGKISYSLYLWHWPVFVFYRQYTNGAPIEPVAAIILVTLAVGIAALSWAFIETPFRRSRGKRLDFTFAGVASVAIVLMALMIRAEDGFPARTPPLGEELSSLEAMWHWDCPQKINVPELAPWPLCVVGARWEAAKTRGILWGDSHAEHMAPLLDQAARERGMSLLVWRSCPAFIDNKHAKRPYSDRPNYSEDCGRAHDSTLDWRREASRRHHDCARIPGVLGLPRLVYVDEESERSEKRGLPILENAMQALISEIDPRTHQIILIGQVPAPNSAPLACLLTEHSQLLRRQDPSCLISSDRLGRSAHPE